MNLLKLMASIGLDSKEYEEGLDNAVDSANRSGSKIGKALIEGGKLLAKGMVAAGGAVATVTTLGVKSYATYEQLSGGVEKLFGDSSKTVMAFAQEAYKSAGMSANEYMDTVTSFSASLISGLGGDTAKAAEVADVAIRAMSDNANTFGTDMESVKNAIMGFSKGNFTMLDNLKLGFAGSQQGMIDLINASGILEGEIKDLDGITFDQMILAVQKVQENLGVAGTTAKEAGSTIEGSFNQMKGAWSNLMNAISDPEQSIGPAIDNLVDSVSTFGDNVIPRVQETMQGIGQAVQVLAPVIAEQLPAVLESVVPGLVSAAFSLISAFGSALVSNAPSLINYAVTTATSLISGLSGGLAEGVPELLSQALPMILSFVEGLRANFGLFVDAGLEFIQSLVQGLANSLPVLIAYVPTIVENIAGLINDNVPKLLVAGWNIIVTLAKGIINAIPALISNIPEIINAIVAVWNAFNWINLGKNVVNFIKNGLKKLPGAAKEIVSNAVNWIKSTFTGGGIEGVVMGIFNKVKNVMTTPIKAAINTIKSVVHTVTSPFQSAFSKVVSIVQGAINKVKSILNITLSFPKPKLPHFVVSGGSPPYGFMGKGTFPSVSVSMYRRAMAAGYEFRNETVIPTASGMKGFGDAGSEIVIGKRNMIDMISEASTAGWTEVAMLLRDIRNVVEISSANLYTIVKDILDEMGTPYDERDLSRLIRKYA